MWKRHSRQQRKKGKGREIRKIDRTFIEKSGEKSDGAARKEGKRNRARMRISEVAYQWIFR